MTTVEDAGGFESPARSGAGRFPAFDGLRAIAATAVLVGHAAFLTGITFRSDAGRYLARAEVGVPVFFVISGFLLYRPFALAHLEGRTATATRRFWRRRVSRIFPAYWVALTFVPLVTGHAIVHSVGDVVAYYGLLQVYDADRALGGIPQAWSLCTELGFYLLLPLVAAVVARRRRERRDQLRAELVLLLGLYAASLLFRVVVLAADPGGPQFTWTPAWLDLFALGMALAVASAWVEATGATPRAIAWVGRHPGVCWLTAAAAFLVLSHLGLPRRVVPTTAGRRLAGQLVGSVVALGLVTPAVFGEGGVIRRLLRSRVAAAVGLVSYSLYLWHLAWLERVLTWTGGRLFDASFAAVLVVGMGAALAVAAVSYVLIERPASTAGEVAPGRSRT